MTDAGHTSATLKRNGAPRSFPTSQAGTLKNSGGNNEDIVRLFGAQQAQNAGQREGEIIEYPLHARTLRGVEPDPMQTDAFPVFDGQEFAAIFRKDAPFRVVGHGGDHLDLMPLTH